MNGDRSEVLRVAVAGASGFVGQAFCRAFHARFVLTGLSRVERHPSEYGPQRWKRCDLFSLLQVERALAGQDVAVYLVHSLLPSARLSQADVADLDLILADNFARAAARCGVRRIVYLGGIIPTTHAPSKHLRSRAEVEQALAAHGVPVTTLRASMIIGSGGSPFNVLRRLVDRLPVLLCPEWTDAPMQPIALDDAVHLLGEAVSDPRWTGLTTDIAGPDVLTYRAMMMDMARISGLHREIYTPPGLGPRVWRRWIELVTGAPDPVVERLVDTLRNPMVAADRHMQDELGLRGMGWEEAATRALREPSPRLRPRHRAARKDWSRQGTVRSVQRLPCPPGASALAIAYDYLRWLPDFMGPLMRAETDGLKACFFLQPLRRPLLVLRLAPERSTEDRSLFYVDGAGMLTRNDGPAGRLEFRITYHRSHVLAAIHDYRPRLPWLLYVTTQALAHLFVMRRFGSYLEHARLPEVPDRHQLPARVGG